MSGNLLYCLDIDGKKCPLKCLNNGELLVGNITTINGNRGNIYCGNLNGTSFTPPLNINNEYKNCILSYIDQSSVGSKLITVWGSVTEENGPVYIYIGSIILSQVRPSVRMGSLNINLSSFKYIKLFNEDNNAISNIIASLISS